MYEVEWRGEPYKSTSASVYSVALHRRHSLASMRHLSLSCPVLSMCMAQCGTTFVLYTDVTTLSIIIV